MPKKHFSKIDVVLSIIALALVISLFLKAIFDVDKNYDVGWYHLPFAARIWDIIPSESFTSGTKVEHRYDGFPLLAHFLQGLFWKVTNRIQTTNLVGYFSVIAYLLFLKNCFKIPLYLSTIAILCIPAVLTHSTRSFVDLPANIGMSILIMMSYNFFRQSRLPSKKELLFAFLGAATAVNTKPQLQPLVFLVYVIVSFRLAYLYWKYTNRTRRKLWLTIPILMLASVIIFTTPIKNTVFYGNPFYPTKVEIAGIVLNHESVPETYSEGERPQKWLRSVFEINTPRWSPDQHNNTSDKTLLDRGGGFFGSYVVFNLLLLAFLTIKRIYTKSLNDDGSRNVLVATTIVLASSIIVSNFPQSHELRYLMFWMIVLVSLNLSLISSSRNLAQNQITLFKVFFAAFFIVMCFKIESEFLFPQFDTFDAYIANIIKPEVLEQVSPEEKNCIISRYDAALKIQHIFYYSSYFHPEITFDYDIQAVPDEQSCNSGKIINPK